MPKGDVKIVSAAFVTGDLTAPFAVEGKRVLATVLRQDEDRYIVIYNDNADAHNPHGARDDEDACDAYVVASARWRKGGRAEIHVIEDGLAWVQAWNRAAEAADLNEG